MGRGDGISREVLPAIFHPQVVEFLPPMKYIAIKLQPSQANYRYATAVVVTRVVLAADVALAVEACTRKQSISAQ